MPIQTLAAATPGQFQFASEAPPSPNIPQLGVAGDAPASIAAVYTALEFQVAFHAGIRDIEIHAHLDLRDLSEPATPVTDKLDDYSIGNAGPSTRSIRVRRAADC